MEAVAHFEWIYLLKMVIVNGYVSLPEANTYQYLPRSTKIYWYMIDTNMAYLSSVCCVGCKHQIDASRWGGPATFPQQTSWSEPPNKSIYSGLSENGVPPIAKGYQDFAYISL